MRQCLRCCLAELVVLAMSVPSVFSAGDLPGYTDGPFLPNSRWRVHDQSRPQPKKVAPGEGFLGATPPEDAVVLFDGTNLNAWRRSDGKPIGDGIAEGAFNIRKTGQIQTKEEFGDCQLHLEWCTPTGPEDRMNWGNSGVHLFGCFEIQILESYASFIYADGNAGAIYGQFPPLVNPAEKPGKWQSFDIVFTAPRFEGEKMMSPAYVTVVYNGVVVQNHQEILGAIAHRTLPGAYPVRERGPVLLQEHHSGVQFRNIWIRPLE
ncbi:MAG: DUF1080 domain-containing protein [Planctomycetaceae bacterium]|nr:DUF1080 domain-containing protein [Planctomycetaceae bacterium]